MQAVTLFYEPLAQASSRVFFALRSLVEINPLYQFSVQTFLHIFNQVVTNNAHLRGLEDKGERLRVLMQDTFASSFQHACLSLQERHKMSLALRLVQLRLQSLGKPLDDAQLEAMLRGVGQRAAALAAGGTQGAAFPPDLLSERQVSRLACLRAFPPFQDVAERMVNDTDAWKTFLTVPLADQCIPKFGADGDANDDVAAAWHNLLLLHALRPERLLAGAKAFVSTVFGPEFLDVGEPDLSRVLDSAPDWQHSFLLTSTAGFDTSGRVEAQAQARGVSCSVIALGSPEGYEAADKAISLSSTRGGWVLLKNVHLAVEWLQQMDKKLHRMQPHAAFRLFMTMEMSASVPNGLVAFAQVVVYEPPTGMKASIQQSFRGMPAERLGKEPVERARLHLLLSWLHGVVLGRLRYSPLGWSKAYEFSETDLRTAADTIDLWVDRAANGRSNLGPERIPWAALRELVALCYGGRIDNEFDEKALRSFLHRFFCQDAYSLDHQLVFPEPAQETGSAPAPILVPEGRTSKAFAEWITALPDSQVPSWVGLPADSDMMLLTRQGTTVLEGWLLLQSALADDEAVVEQEGAGGASERSALPVGTQGGHLGPGTTSAGTTSGPKWSRSLAASVEKWLAQMPAPLEAPQKGSEDPVLRCVYREMLLAAQVRALRVLPTLRTPGAPHRCPDPWPCVCACMQPC